MFLRLPESEQLGEAWERTHGFSFERHVVVAYRVGSHSHGTHIPPTDPKGIDDDDVMAIVIPPQRNVLGLRRFEHAVVKDGALDMVVYEWGKYIRLLLKSNPNVLGTLWMDPEFIYRPTPDWGPAHELQWYRQSFASQQAYASFVGYAKAQLYKMTHHAHQGYMGEKRKRLVERYGYDVKNAAHLVRLLRMAVGFLRTGEMIVFRPDAKELKDIKRGLWSLQQVQDEAEGLFAEAEEAYASTKLPERPDTAKIEQLMLDGYNTQWREYTTESDD